jgi:hypothetical protein
MLLALLTACTGTGKETGEETFPAPTVEWVAPTDGDTVAAGDVACSVAVGNFTLQSPAKHNEGQPEGYLSVSVDGTEALQTAETTFTLTLEGGAHTLAGQLYYVDGDEVTATADRVCDEDDTDAACAPVVASIDVTAGLAAR